LFFFFITAPFNAVTSSACILLFVDFITTLVCHVLRHFFLPRLPYFDFKTVNTVATSITCRDVI